MAEEVAALAEEIDGSNSETTYEEVLKELQGEQGQVKMAFCPSRPNGSRYVYYPCSLPDPSGLRWVKVEGQRQDPDGQNKDSRVSDGREEIQAQYHPAQRREAREQRLREVAYTKPNIKRGQRWSHGVKG